MKKVREKDTKHIFCKKLKLYLFRLLVYNLEISYNTLDFNLYLYVKYIIFKLYEETQSLFNFNSKEIKLKFNKNAIEIKIYNEFSWVLNVFQDDFRSDDVGVLKAMLTYFKKSLGKTFESPWKIENLCKVYNKK